MNIVTIKEQVDHYLNATRDARFFSERDRDYKDHKQWTPQQLAKLASRNQAPVVVNRIKPKVEGLLGLYNMRRVDPKAYPRTQKHEDSAHAVTDALRFVADNNDFDAIKIEVADDFWVEGTGAGIVEVKQKKSGEIEVRVSRIPWDRFYFDPHSREKDFEDARFMGMIQWLGEDQIEEMFSDVDPSTLYTEGTTDETHEDRPRWYDKDRKRIRVAYHFFIHKGEWHYSIFSGDTLLVDAQVSPFLDDDGEPSCPIEAVSCNIDRDNNRFGEVRGYIDSQNEINHRRSKALHLLSQRQTYGRTGAVDPEVLKRELAKPNGHVPFNGEKFGDDFGVLPTGDMAQGQFELYQDAKAELDAVGMNAQLAGERQSGELSGKAIGKLQQAGTLELNRQFSLLTNWEKRIYRQIWARVKQFWNEEKWIRVTDDQSNLRWVGLNTKITAQEWLEEQINDESKDLEQRRQAAASFQFLSQASQSPDPQTAQAAQAKLQEIVEVKNDTTELDVDIIIDQTFDTINAEEEQFQMLAQFGQQGGIDIIELIEVSQIRGKEELIEKIEKRRAEAAQAAGNVAEKESQALEVKNAKTFADAQVSSKKAEQMAIENQLLIRSPDEKPQVSV